MRLLTLEIHEPLPGLVLPKMAEVCGQEEAARRYRAIVLTTLYQLRGLANSRIRLWVNSEEASEAVRFWILPKLADQWESCDGVFRTSGWEIDFANEGGNFAIRASGDILCPYLGARWVHTALLGLGHSIREVIGPADGGGIYFHATCLERTENLPRRVLPELPRILTEDDWLHALEGPLGAALKKHREADK